MVEGFEADFAGFCGVPHCIGVSSGTDALRFALIASGIGNHDTVITVPNTFVATTEAITQAGAIPEFVDVDGRDFRLRDGSPGLPENNPCGVLIGALPGGGP